MQSGYFEELFAGDKGSILKKSYVKYYAKKEAATSYDSEVPERFQRFDHLFFKTPSGTLKELPNSKKKIMDLFPDMKNDLKKFIKENKLNFKDDADFVKLGEFLNKA